MENHIEMDDVGGKPTIFGNIHKIQPFYRPVAVQANRRERKGVLRVARWPISGNHGSCSWQKLSGDSVVLEVFFLLATYYIPWRSFVELEQSWTNGVQILQERTVWLQLDFECEVYMHHQTEPIYPMLQINAN